MKSILLVDDDVEEHLIFADALAMLPVAFYCDHEKNPEMALIRMCNKNYDFIFLDLYMPKINGIQCAQRIRMMKEYRHTPIFLYSTSITPESMGEATDAGITALVTKSFTLEELAERLDGFLTAKVR